jgi:hypothetical protein
MVLVGCTGSDAKLIEVRKKVSTVSCLYCKAKEAHVAEKTMEQYQPMIRHHRVD